MSRFRFGGGRHAGRELPAQGDTAAAEPVTRIPLDAMFVHVHVPKCGGTSFRNLLRHWFRDGHRNLHVDRTSFTYEPDVLARTIASDSRILSISSHFIRLFPAVIGRRVALYTTFLRDPVRQFLSYLTYIKKVFPHIVDPELLRYLPQDVPDMQLQDMAEWILTREAAIPFKENYTVNFFAEFAWCANSGYERPQSPYGTDAWDPVQFERYRAVRLELTQSILSNFFFVGLVEDLDGGVRHFVSRCADMGLHLPAATPGHDNVSSELLDDLKWLHPGSRVGALLFAALRDDFELYRWASARYQRAVSGSTPASVRYDGYLVSLDPGKSDVYRIQYGSKRLVAAAGEAAADAGVQNIRSISERDLNSIPVGLEIV